MRDDLRWALRHARRHPAFALAIAATLAISIAAATTAFGLATAVLWRPLSFHDASKLVFLWEDSDRDRDGAISVRGVRVSANYFNALGIHAILGRTFAPDDEEPGTHRVVMLSHGLWRERFGGRREVIGQTLLVDVSARDPGTLAKVAVVLLGVAAAAALVPARRAARIDPVAALRAE